MQQERYDSALYYAEEAAALMRGTIGENNIRYAAMLRNLAISHYYIGSYKKGKYYILKEVDLRESLKGTGELEYITSLEVASVICRKAGSYDEALEQIKKADRKAQGLYDLNSAEYADLLDYYAGVCHDLGCPVNDMVFINQEGKYLKRAEAIYTSYGGKYNHAEVIIKSELAAYNNNIGNFPAAESLLLEVIELCRKEYGPASTGYASALNNLAVVYYNKGDYKLAEKYFNNAIGIYKNGSPVNNTQSAICINNLGAMYYEIGNYRVAGKLVSEARMIYESSPQVNSPDYAVVLNNEAAFFITEEYYSDAEKKSRERLLNSGRMLIKADSVFRQNCQKPHTYDQAITGNLAIWYNIIGEKEKSVKMMNALAWDANISMRVVSMMKKISISGQLAFLTDTRLQTGPAPVIIPVSIDLYEEITASSVENNPVESDVVLRALLKMIIGKAANVKKAVGPYHPAYAGILKSLIISYSSFDDVRSEEELTLEYMDVINHKTLQDFSFLSENEKEMYYQTRLPDVNSFIAYSLTRKRANPIITRYTYNNILLNKGLMLKSSTAMRLAILNSNNPVLLKEYDEWITLQKEISVLYSTPVEMRDKDVSELENKANALERSLVSSSQDFNDYRKGLQITWEDVRKSLNPDEAAIEFTDFKKREKDGGDAVTYCALVVRSGSEYPEMIKLFTEDQLKAIIEKSGANNLSDINDIYGTAKNQNEKLYELIWKPIEVYLTGIKNVIISPSGLLYKISFPAISNGKNVYLCDRYQVQVKGSTGIIVTQSLFAEGNKPSALVFGGIQYSANKSDSDVWSFLKGTKDEGDAVNSILSGAQIDVRYLSGNSATESFFKQNSGGYNILHLATHGFFFDDPNEVRFEEKKPEVEYGQIVFRGAARGYGVNSFVNSENPLMRSGLVLAGANDVWIKTEKGESDDGVLTAQEVTQIDMRKNDLVVLSACETGLGDIKGTEGVYGLQRALKMAGVKYIIMSLWEIPDKETVEFMGMFYYNLLKVKDIKEAFYAAQKEMRAKYDPYYWGAFVLME
jgi:CHAT domain-containing protein/tetratricopeptide (TPR) repeat protein